MDLVLLAARLILAAVLAVAGAAKLADLDGSRRAVAGFGVPERPARFLGTVLPLAELAVAAALLPAATAWWAACAALVLLLAFLAGIGLNLARGRRPDCHCFGRLQSEPIGSATALRNAALAALAGLVVGWGRADPGPSLLPVGGPALAVLGGAAAAVVLLAVLAAQWWSLINLLRQNGRLLARVEALEARLGVAGEARTPEAAGGPRSGDRAPAFELPGLDGTPVALDGLLAGGRPVLLAFTDPGCGPCDAVIPDLARAQRERAGELAIALISRGDLADNLAKAAQHGLRQVLVQRDWEVAEAYAVGRTPSAVLVRPDGTLGANTAAGPDAIRSLLARALEREPLRVGQPAPVLSLPDLDRKPLEVGRPAGYPTLLLFWNPRCGFCQRMLEDLRAWEARPPRGAPRLLVVSTGTVQENRELGLRSTVLLDEGFATGRAFGADGTPSAVLLDARGRIASELAVGAPAIFRLIGSPHRPPQAGARKVVEA